jgi:hypothetical protein
MHIVMESILKIKNNAAILVIKENLLIQLFQFLTKYDLLCF